MSCFSAVGKKAFGNAGRTYSTGNYLALAGSLAQIFIGTERKLYIPQLTKFFTGDIPSCLTTLGTACYLYSGSRYDAAWRKGAPPDESKNREGHIGGAAGATFMGVGLAILGRHGLPFWTAITGGGLHAGGKFGSLLDREHDKFYKVLPLLSRIPTILSAGHDISENFLKYPHNPWTALAHSVLPTTLVVCNSIWGRADTMLMLDNPVKRTMNRMPLVSDAKPG